MPTTPPWAAAVNGLPGRSTATNQAEQIDQFLGTHGIVPVYEGAEILAPAGGTHFSWLTWGNSDDLAQPFTLSGTSIGRVTIPVSWSGNGANLYVSLWPDNGSGQPATTGDPLAATMVPAAEITVLAAPDGLSAGGPLAVPMNHTRYCTGGVTTTSWAAPAGNSTGVAASSVATTSGDYFIFLGGENLDGSFSTVVATAQFLGGGSLSLPQAQPALPQGLLLGSVATTSSILIHMGGIVTGGSPTANVWSASWDPNTGTAGTWSAATALPVATSSAGTATWNDSTVYYVGGTTSVAVSTVYYANISNGQVGSWTAGPSLPVAASNAMVAVIGNWLVVAGGYNNLSTFAGLTGCYYAPINADGSLGGWQTGPKLPVGVYAYACGWQSCATADAMMIFAGQTTSSTSTSAIQTLSVNADGVGDRWVQSTFSNGGDIVAGLFPLGNGQYQAMFPLIYAGEYLASTVLPVPALSVPLAATGLASGATYHVMMQQYQSTSASDYLSFGLLDDIPLPDNALYRSRNSGPWNTVDSSYAVPITVFDTTPGGPILHTYEDGATAGIGGAPRHTSLQYNNQALLLGYVETTSQLDIALNSNPTFASGVSPWTASGGTVTQSSAQVHGGFAFSGLLTPSGSAGTASALSELFPVNAGSGPFYGSSVWVILNGWFYSTPGYSNFSASVNWYDQSKTYLSTSNHTQSLTAATWTSVQNYYLVPEYAAYAQINALEAGTPASSALLYLSDVFLTVSPECVGAFTSAAAVEYPTGSLWPPLGVEQLL